jgi:hypothetical protein
MANAQLLGYGDAQTLQNTPIKRKRKNGSQLYR